MRYPTPLIAVLVVSVASLGGCFNTERSAPREPTSAAAAQPIPRSEPLPAGTYDVQDVRYDDATGNYQLFLLGVPPGRKPLFQHADVQLARLPDAEVAEGKKAYFEVTEAGEQVLHLPATYDITYVHNVTDERVDPVTGQPETVVVRQETSSWSPFASALAGAALGNMLFAPRYYYPPPYNPGGMTGFGGAGPSRAMAGSAYAERYGSPPRAATLSRTGQAPRKVSPDSVRSSGRGAGASRWQKSTRPTRRPRGFGGFGRGRRR